MSKARDLGNLLDTDGDVISSSLDNVPAPSKTSIEALGIALPAANLTGTIHADRYTDTVYTHPTTAGNKHIPTAGATDQVLTYSSSGTASWADPAGGGLESGTKTDFFQASAPTGWTQNTSHNDKMLRVVSGNGGGTGGTAATSSPAHSLSAGAHTLTVAEMPSHSHTASLRAGGGDEQTGYYLEGPGYSYPSSVGTSSTGGGGSHDHSLSGSITTPAYMDVIIASKD